MDPADIRRTIIALPVMMNAFQQQKQTNAIEEASRMQERITKAIATLKTAITEEGPIHSSIETIDKKWKKLTQDDGDTNANMSEVIADVKKLYSDIVLSPQLGSTGTSPPATGSSSTSMTPMDEEYEVLALVREHQMKKLAEELGDRIPNTISLFNEVFIAIALGDFGTSLSQELEERSPMIMSAESIKKLALYSLSQQPGGITKETLPEGLFLAENEIKLLQDSLSILEPRNWGDYIANQLPGADLEKVLSNVISNWKLSREDFNILLTFAKPLTAEETITSLLKRGKVEEAFLRFEEVKNELENKDRILSSICSTFFQKRNFEKAQELALRIDDLDIRTDVLTGIVRGLTMIASDLARTGNVEAAKKTLREINNNLFQARAFGEIAKIFARMGNVQAAQETAATISVDWAKANAFVEIGKIFAQNNNLKDAEEAAEAAKGALVMRDDWSDDDLRSKIVQVFIRVGNLERAKEMALTIINDDDKTNALNQIPKI